MTTWDTGPRIGAETALQRAFPDFSEGNGGDRGNRQAAEARRVVGLIGYFANLPFSMPYLEVTITPSALSGLAE
jgi:hypothetical protein